MSYKKIYTHRHERLATGFTSDLLTAHFLEFHIRCYHKIKFFIAILMDTTNLLIMMHVLLLTYSGVSHTLKWNVGGTMDNLQISILVTVLRIGCMT